jgi:heme oxygenase
MTIIDPPSPFDPVQKWQEFLAELKAIQNPDQSVLEAITEAQQMIAELNAATA